MSKLPNAPKGWRECSYVEFYENYSNNLPCGEFRKEEPRRKRKYFIPIEPITASVVTCFHERATTLRLMCEELGMDNLAWHGLLGKKFKVTMEEVME